MRNNQGGNQGGAQLNVRVFAIAHQDAEAVNTVVEDMVLISRHEANALFDSGSTHYFVSHVYASKLENPPSALAHALVVPLENKFALELYTMIVC